MAEAATKFKQLLDEAKFTDAKVPVLSNVDPTPSTSATILKERLSKQMTGSVRWREIMLALPQQEITQVLEVGPGKVLAGLLKRACSEIEVCNIRSLEDF